ncbi:MAG: thiamine phosphate synthase [Dichotomicrobium sp.]
MGAVKQQEPCQIYLAVQSQMDVGTVSAMLEGRRAASLLVYSDDGLSPAVDTARLLLATAHGQGIPLVIADDSELANQIGADGVHIPANEERYALCRERLGPEAIIGAGCGTSRHDALVLAEQGADYIAFGPEPGQPDDCGDVTELVSWWQEVCEPPVVGWHRGGWDNAAALIAAGADFIGVSALITQADDPPAALDRLSRLIAEQSH